jgi:hypothetical protein
MHHHVIWTLTPTLARHAFSAAATAWAEDSWHSSNMFPAPHLVQRDCGYVNKSILLWWCIFSRSRSQLVSSRWCHSSCLTYLLLSALCLHPIVTILTNLPLCPIPNGCEHVLTFCLGCDQGVMVQRGGISRSYEGGGASLKDIRPILI